MSDASTILLACDLDRTVLSNGPEKESVGAGSEFAAFASQPHVVLAYLSGRSLPLIEKAIQEYDIPTPDIAVGDVGTTMYFANTGTWKLHTPWTDQMAKNWAGYSGKDIHAFLQDIPELTPQEAEKQNAFKQSYYTPENIDKNVLIKKVEERLEEHGIHAAVIFSIDHLSHQGLLDILPKNATKRHALTYLQEHLKLPADAIVFAGDSGNDIDALTSGYYAILVANAREEVREEVRRIAEEKNITDRIYFAGGNYHNMNGNYRAGILEGLAHFGHHYISINKTSLSTSNTQ